MPQKNLWTSYNKKWEINLTADGTMITDGWICYWPIETYDHKVAYDFPERIPLYVREACERLYRKGIAKDRLDIPIEERVELSEIHRVYVPNLGYVNRGGLLG